MLEYWQHVVVLSLVALAIAHLTWRLAHWFRRRMPGCGSACARCPSSQASSAKPSDLVTLDIQPPPPPPRYEAPAS